MDLKVIYEMQTNSAIRSPRQYIDTNTKNKKSFVGKHKHKISFFEELQNQTKKTPGPGKYVINPEKIESKLRSKLKMDMKHHDNFIDQIIKNKQKIPSVGRYNLIDEKISPEKKQWYQVMHNKVRKSVEVFRNTVFDQNNLDTAQLGPGIYQPYRFMWENKYQNAIKPGILKPKKTKSLAVLPSPLTYEPIPSSYETFARKLSVRLSSEGEPALNSKSTFGKSKRSQINQKSMSPGPKYSLIAEWSPKSKGLDKGSQKNMFKSTRKMSLPSIYN